LKTTNLIGMGRRIHTSTPKFPHSEQFVLTLQAQQPNSLTNITRGVNNGYLWEKGSPQEKQLY
jgi:hypothetical protein